MKNGIFVMMALFFITACDDDKNNNDARVKEVENTALNGQWKITYFFDTDSDETDDFTGYVFDFAANDVLTATKGSTTVTGTWSVTNDDHSDDDNNDDYDDIDFNIFFAAPADFEELTEDWEIISITDSKIELRHESGGNGGIDFLTFEKL